MSQHDKLAATKVSSSSKLSSFPERFA